MGNAVSERPRPEYLAAYFLSEPPPDGVPKRFGIVTAYDAHGVPQSEEANLRADAELRRLLKESGRLHFPVAGGSRDGTHREPGFAVAADSPEDIRPLSRRFAQVGFFWVEDGVLYLIHTRSFVRHRVDLWSNRQL